MPAPAISDYARGFLVTALGVLIISPDALLIRLIGADEWTILFWRGMGFFTVQAAIVTARYGRGTLEALGRTGLTGLGIALMMGMSNSLFVISISNTAVANTLIIIASAPLVAALLGRVFLKERLKPRTLAAGLVAFGCVGVTVLGGVGSGGWIGDLAAVVLMVEMAIFLTVLRRTRGTDMLPALACGGIVTCLVGLAGSSVLVPAPADWPWIALLSLVVSPVSFVFISIGPRYLPAPEVSLLMLLETVLGPLWVWLVLTEKPADAALAAGAAMVATLVVHAWLGHKEELARRGAPAPARTAP
ncbi:DMT family transporter [Geminicoccaceae bacterium 1502E]|nr:DMT family transporter [Geminicoccaceae bacterium 1502E]